MMLRGEKKNIKFFLHSSMAAAGSKRSSQDLDFGVDRLLWER